MNRMSTTSQVGSGVEIIAPLSSSELSRIGRLEETIRASMQSFVEVGAALKEIRENRLYRSGFTTFEAYCKDRWNISRRYAHYLIESSDVVANLCTIVHKSLPATETQCRPLICLEPEQQQAAWIAAEQKAGDAPVTAKIVSATVAELFPKAEPQTPESDDDSDESEDSGKPLTWLEALRAASRKKQITSAEFAHIQGKSTNTGDTRKALDAIARSSGFVIQKLKDQLYRVSKAPTDQEAIANTFAKLSPNEKMALLRKLSGDPDVMRIRSEKQTQEMRKGDKATSLEAAAAYIEQAGHELHKYQTNFGAHFGWLSNALKTEQGTAEVVSMIGRLDRIASDSVAYSKALNERTKHV